MAALNATKTPNNHQKDSNFNNFQCYKTHAGDFDELPLLRRPEVGVGKPRHKEPDSPASPEPAFVPDDEPKNQRREEEEDEEEGGIVDGGEDEEGEGEGGGEEGDEDVDDGAGEGIAAVAGAPPAGDSDRGVCGGGGGGGGVGRAHGGREGRGKVSKQEGKSQFTFCHSLARLKKLTPLTVSL